MSRKTMKVTGQQPPMQPRMRPSDADQSEAKDSARLRRLAEILRKEAEVLAVELTEELAMINSALTASGLEYPLGYRGVKHLIEQANSTHQLVEEFAKQLREAKAELESLKSGDNLIERDVPDEFMSGMVKAPEEPFQPMPSRLMVLEPDVFSIPAQVLKGLKDGQSITVEALGVGSLTVTKVDAWAKPADTMRGGISDEAFTQFDDDDEPEGVFGYGNARSINDIEEEMAGLRGRLEFLVNELKNYSQMSHLPHYFANDGDGGPLRCVRCGEHEEGLLSGNATCPGYNLKESDGRPDQADCTPAPKRVQLVVMHNDNTATFHDSQGGWKIDSTNRTLLIGKGLGRVMVPLDNVRYFSPEAY